MVSRAIYPGKSPLLDNTFTAKQDAFAHNLRLYVIILVCMLKLRCDFKAFHVKKSEAFSLKYKKG